MKSSVSVFALVGMRRCIAIVCISTSSVIGCGEVEPTLPTANLGLEVESRVELEEDADDVLGEIGAFAESQDGGFIIADAFRARIRKYDADGRLESAFGVHGAGPFEFRRIRGVLDLDGSGILAIDPILGRITLLTDSLQPDTSYTQVPRPRGTVFRFGNGLLLHVAPADRQSAVGFVAADNRLEWTAPLRDWPIHQYPYWGSAGASLMAAADNEFVTGFSLVYPILIHDSAGSVIDSIAQPPGFRTASVPAPGAFAGANADERTTQWLESFDVIAAVAIVQDSLLVVTRGNILGDARRRVTVHRFLDVYHLPTRTPLVMGIPLDDGSRVLGGGRYLYVLVDQPPRPWTIERVSITARADM